MSQLKSNLPDAARRLTTFNESADAVNILMV